MYYLKLNLPANGSIRPTEIEFTNNWMGEESVFVNGALVSKKSSIFGTDHYFSIVEFGRSTRYTLTTKMAFNATGVAIDLSRNGIKIKENITIPLGSKPKNPFGKIKKKAIARLYEYDLDAALLDFEYALEKSPNDGEIYFYMACAHSVEERSEEGFYALAQAVHLGFANKERILDHDMLAFLRMNAAFDDFATSDFRNYDVNLVRLKEEEFV